MARARSAVQAFMAANQIVQSVDVAVEVSFVRKVSNSKD